MKAIIALCALLLLSLQSYAAEPLTNFDEALRQAKAGGKMLFIEFGRENCTSCKELKEMIRTGRVEVPDSKYVLTYLDCDDKVNSDIIDNKFKIKDHKLPFVVIADSEGKLLVMKAGLGAASDYTGLMADVERLAPPSKDR